MTSLLPLQSVILILLLLNLVFCLDFSHHQRLKKDSASSRPPLLARDDYSNFNLTDHHISNDSSEPTKTNNYPPLRSPPSVTTIIIIKTNDGQTYHELGGGPSPMASSNNDSIGDPNGGDVNAIVDHDNKVLKRIISITTVVGGVGVVLIIAGTVLFVRMRSKQRRMKLIQQCQLPSSSIISGTQGNGNDTNHQRNQSSSSSSSTSSPSNPHDDEEAIEMTSTVIPSAPPETTLLPDHSRSRLLQSLQLQTLIPSSSSTFSPPTTSSIPAPSAPSAKELELSSLPSTLPLSLPSSPLVQQSLLPSSSTYDQVSLDTTHSISKSSPSSPSSPSPSAPSSPSSPSSSSRTTPALHLKPMAGIHGSNSTDQTPSHPTATPELPPPAYTPSAPPLFALPPSRRRRSADELSLDRYKRNL